MSGSLSFLSNSDLTAQCIEKGKDFVEIASLNTDNNKGDNRSENFIPFEKSLSDCLSYLHDRKIPLQFSQQLRAYRRNWCGLGRVLQNRDSLCGILRNRSDYASILQNSGNLGSVLQNNGGLGCVLPNNGGLCSILPNKGGLGSIFQNNGGLRQWLKRRLMWLLTWTEGTRTDRRKRNRRNENTWGFKHRMRGHGGGQSQSPIPASRLKS